MKNLIWILKKAERKWWVLEWVWVDLSLQWLIAKVQKSTDEGHEHSGIDQNPKRKSHHINSSTALLRRGEKNLNAPWGCCLPNLSLSCCRYSPCYAMYVISYAMYLCMYAETELKWVWFFQYLCKVLKGCILIGRGGDARLAWRYLKDLQPYPKLLIYCYVVVTLRD